MASKLLENRTSKTTSKDHSFSQGSGKSGNHRSGFPCRPYFGPLRACLVRVFASACIVALSFPILCPCACCKVLKERSSSLVLSSLGFSEPCQSPDWTLRYFEALSISVLPAVFSTGMLRGGKGRERELQLGSELPSGGVPGPGDAVAPGHVPAGCCCC